MKRYSILIHAQQSDPGTGPTSQQISEAIELALMGLGVELVSQRVESNESSS